MLRLEMRRGESHSDATQGFEELLARLRQHWPALIRPLQDLQTSQFNVESSDLRWGTAVRRGAGYDASDSPNQGEIFAVDGGLVVLTLTHAVATDAYRFTTDNEGNLVAAQDMDAAFRIDATALTHAETSEALEQVSQAATEILSIALTPRNFQNQRFDALRSEAVAEELPTEQTYVDASVALADRNSRTLAVAIKSSRGLLARDTSRHLIEGIDAALLLDNLVTAGVATKEVVIVCTNSGAQVARVPEEASLKPLAEAGLRCACGRSIDAEQPEELYTITERGALLLDKSRWMSVLLRDKLQQLGVPAHDILLECQIGSDEIDCIALISGEISIFELKDKDFSIGNAYSFGAKMSILNPSHAVIITTESVSADVKSHFSRQRSQSRYPRYTFGEAGRQSVNYVEGPGFLTQLESVIGEIYAKDGQNILDAALALGVVRSESLVRALQSRALDLR